MMKGRLLQAAHEGTKDVVERLLRPCLHVYMCVYIYICVYVYICVYMCIYVYIRVYRKRDR